MAVKGVYITRSIEKYIGLLMVMGRLSQEYQYWYINLYKNIIVSVLKALDIVPESKKARYEREIFKKLCLSQRTKLTKSTHLHAGMIIFTTPYHIWCQQPLYNRKVSK